MEPLCTVRVHAGRRRRERLRGASSSKGQSVRAWAEPASRPCPAKRGRSGAESLDAGEHVLTLAGPTMPVAATSMGRVGGRAGAGLPDTGGPAQRGRRQGAQAADADERLHTVRPQSPMHTTPLTPPWLPRTVGRYASRTTRSSVSSWRSTAADRERYRTALNDRVRDNEGYDGGRRRSVIVDRPRSVGRPS